MQYELRQLESILNGKIAYQQEMLAAEQERIEQALLEIIYGDRPRENVTIYVQQHAKALLRLLERIAAMNNKVIAAPLSQVFVDLLSFLEEHGDLYWNYQLSAPDFIQQPILEAARATFSLNRERIEFMPIEATLSKEIVNNLQKLVYSEQSLCYGQLYLLRDLPAALSNLPPNEEERPENSCQVIELLCRYNCNSQNLFNWGKQEVLRREALIPENSDTIFMLKRLQIFLKRIQTEHGYYYYPHRPGLSLQFSEYINDRLDLKKRESQPIAVQAIRAGSLAEDQQIHTSVSEEFLCFLFRLFLDLKIFRSNNMRALARFLGASFITVHQKNTDNTDISGIYTCLYSPRLPTVMRVEELLHQMLKRVQEWKVALKTTGKPPKDSTTIK